METEIPRMQVLALVRKAYGQAVSNGAPLLRTIGGWVALYAATLTAWTYGLIWLIGNNIDLRLWFSSFSPRVQDFLFAVGPTLIALVAVSAVAVAWHRFVLLGVQHVARRSIRRTRHGNTRGGPHLSRHRLSRSRRIRRSAGRGSRCRSYPYSNPADYLDRHSLPVCPNRRVFTGSSRCRREVDP
jgi:hypothetical protein